MMVRRLLLTLLLIIFVGVVFHAPLSVFFGTVFPGFQVEIKAWKELLLGVVVLLTAVEATRHHVWRELARDNILRIVGAYVALHIILLLFMWQGAVPAIAGLMIDLRFVVFFVSVYVTTCLYPQWRTPIIIGSGIAAAASLVFAVLQVTVLPHDILSHIGYSRATIAPYLTVDQNYDYIRINGTLRGPNPLGVYAAMILAASLAALLIMRKKMQQRHALLVWGVGALALCAVVALWFSYSRSALIAAVLAVGVVVAVRFGGRISRRVWVAVAVAAVLVAGGLYIARDTTFVSQVILHEDPNEGNAVNSNDGHWESLVDGTERMLRQPLGAGIGSTGSPSLMGEKSFIIENYYLYVAHEAGWLGLGLFMALFIVVVRSLWSRRRDWLALALFASGMGAAVASLFLPVWADDTVALLWWGLAGVALGAVKIKPKERKADGRTIK